MELVGDELDRAELLAEVAEARNVRQLAAALFRVTGPGDTDEGFINHAEAAISAYLSSLAPAEPGVDGDAIEAAAKAMCKAADEDWGATSALETANGCEPEEMRAYWRDMAHIAIAKVAKVAAPEAKPAATVDEIAGIIAGIIDEPHFYNGLAFQTAAKAVIERLTQPPSSEPIGYLVQGFDGKPFYAEDREQYDRQGHAVVPIYTHPSPVEGDAKPVAVQWRYKPKSREAWGPWGNWDPTLGSYSDWDKQSRPLYGDSAAHPSLLEECREALKAEATRIGFLSVEDIDRILTKLEAGR